MFGQEERIDGKLKGKAHVDGLPMYDKHAGSPHQFKSLSCPILHATWKFEGTETVYAGGCSPY